MKYTNVLVAAFAAFALVSAASAQEEVTLRPQKMAARQDPKLDQDPVKVYFLTALSGCALAGDGEISANDIARDFRFTLNASLDTLGGNLGSHVLGTTQARRKALRALGMDPEIALITDDGDTDPPEYVCAVRFSLTADLPQRGGSVRVRGVDVSAGDRRAIITLTAQVVCFRYDGKGKNIPCQPIAVKRTLKLGSDIDVNFDGGVPIFKFLRHTSGDYHDSGSRSAIPALVPMEQELANKIADCLRSHLSG